MISDAVVNNFEIGSNFVKFQENLCKTFHGGLTNLKLSRLLNIFVILLDSCTSDVLCKFSSYIHVLLDWYKLKLKIVVHSTLGRSSQSLV